MCVVGAFGRGGEPQAEGGDGAGRRQAVGGAGKVVAFVEDDESEAVSQPLHVQIGRVVGGHRDRLDVVIAAAQEPDFDVEAQGELVVPLIQEVDRRRDDQRGPAGFFDRHAGEVGLAGSGRQHDHSSSARIPPGLQGLDLVRETLLGRLAAATGPAGSRARYRCSSVFRCADARRSMRYEIAGARNWRVRGSNFTPGKLGSSSAVGPSTTSVPASKSSRSGDALPVGGVAGRAHRRDSPEDVKLGFAIGAVVSLEPADAHCSV